METTIQNKPQIEANVEKIVRTVIVEKLGIEPDKFSLGTDFSRDLGVDSLDMMEIFMELEKKFNMTILDEEAEKMRTLESIVSFIQKIKINHQ
jgi:acyl carrier protein